MVYDAARINSVLRLIAKKAVQFSDDIIHKHNLLDRHAKQPPFKINLCTRELRRSAEMESADIDAVAQLLYDFVTSHNLNIPALAGVPRAGHELGVRVHGLLTRAGYSIPYLTLQKEKDECVLVDNGATVPGEVWLVDDLSNRGITKNWARRPLIKAGWRVSGVLVALDYGMGAASALGELGMELHYVASVDTTLMLGRDTLPHKARDFEGALHYLAKERALLAAT